MMEWCGGLLDTLHEYTVPSQPVFSVPGNFKVLRVWARKDSFTVYLESTNPKIGIQRYFEHQTRKDRFQVPNMNDCYTCTDFDVVLCFFLFSVFLSSINKLCSVVKVRVKEKTVIIFLFLDYQHILPLILFSIY